MLGSKKPYGAMHRIEPGSLVQKPIYYIPLIEIWTSENTVLSSLCRPRVPNGFTEPGITHWTVEDSHRSRPYETEPITAGNKEWNEPAPGRICQALCAL